METRSRPTSDPAPAHSSPPREGGGWIVSILLGAVLVPIYLANGPGIVTYDTTATTAIPLTLLRGDGLSLDYFARRWGVGGEQFAEFMVPSRGHLVSRYPVAPALVALPVYAVEIAVRDRVEPGWRRDRQREWDVCLDMAKHAAALIAAATAVVLHRILKGLGLGRVAVPAVLAAALGSDLWEVGSQALWQHGPAALALATAILLLLPRDPSGPRLALGGLATAALVAFRLVDLVMAVVIAAWVVRTHPRRIAWFVPGPIVVGAALLAYNLWFFGTVVGGQAGLEARHPAIHAVAGPWAGDLLEGLLGTLVSPSRGLFVFSPWVVVALATAPWAARRLAAFPLVGWVLWALVPYCLLLSKYAVWWGGHSFGPRYWTDVMPLFAILLAAGLDWAYDRRRGVALIAALAIAASIAIQAVGAFLFPSSWNGKPENVDFHHERLWDWRDSELSRCLVEWLNKT